MMYLMIAIEQERFHATCTLYQLYGCLPSFLSVVISCFFLFKIPLVYQYSAGGGLVKVLFKYDT